VGNIGGYDRAIEEFNHAIQINPKFPLAYNNRGLAYKAIGQYDRAIDDFSQAVTINPHNFEAYCNRGVAYCAKRNALPDRSPEKRRAGDAISGAVALNIRAITYNLLSAHRGQAFFGFNRG
jgi:tetratricopeptide (TPR) repeat protein